VRKSTSSSKIRSKQEGLELVREGRKVGASGRFSLIGAGGVGAGFRGSGVWVENPSADNFRTLFSIDNARVFLNGQIHKYIKFESYTDCTFCNNTDPGDNPKMSYTVLAAIGKVEINRYINIWGGRMQIPTERGELAGPFYQATHDAFKTPSFPQGFSTKFGSGGAGRYGHDEGVTF
jgi:hypothetical protein